MSRWDAEQGPEDALARELRALPATGWQVPAGGAAAAVRAGRRRVVAKVAGVSALCAALVVGVPVGLSAGGTSAAPVPPVPPAVERPEPSPSPTEAPSAAPSVVAPATAEAPAPPPPPSSAPSDPATEAEPVEEPATPAVLEVSASSTGASLAGDLAGLEVPDLVFGAGETSDVVLGPASWPFDPCDLGAHEADRLRTGWAALSRRSVNAGSGAVHQAVATYPSEEVARQVVRSFARLGEDCWQEEAGGPSRLWRTEQASDDGLRGAFRTYAEPTAEEQAEAARSLAETGYEAPPVRDGGYLVVVRDGRRVAMVMAELEGAGGYVAGSEGDERPGSGAQPLSNPEDDRSEVDAKLMFVSQDAEALAAAAAALDR